MKEFRVGVIGFGIRGVAITKTAASVEGVKITAVCDNYEERLDGISKYLESKHGEAPKLKTTNYKDIINSDDVDVIMICAAWEAHIPIAIDAMKAGKPVAVEIAGAYSVEQCWDLVKVYEETKTPIMMLENCCYGRVELMLLNMIEKGFFGTVVHCNGAYCHDLRKEIVSGGLKDGKHYRFRNYKNRCCENYPTHELGPIARMLKINHGNRFESIVSVSSKSVGLHEYVEKNHPEEKELAEMTFNQGDVVSSVIKCSNGETITLSLQTTLPRFYTRDLKVHGTKAMYDDSTKSVFVDDSEMAHGDEISTKMNNAAEYIKEYDHPLWIEYEKEGIRSGHGGMDWLVVKAFFDALKEDKPMPIDVYDMATWMAVTPLSEESIKKGGTVTFPDFTNGRWILE